MRSWPTPFCNWRSSGRLSMGKRYAVYLQYESGERTRYTVWFPVVGLAELACESLWHQITGTDTDVASVQVLDEDENLYSELEA